MEKNTKFKIAAWATLAISIAVILGAFDPYILFYGDFYFYLILISGIVGLIGVLFSLGILPIFGGIAISAGMMYLSTLAGFNPPLLFAFLRAVLLIIAGCGMVLWVEFPENPLSLELIRLDIGKTEYFELKTLGITNLKQLVEEKGHEEEICALTSISLSQMKTWVEQAEKIIQETEKLRKAQLQEDYQRKKKN